MKKYLLFAVSLLTALTMVTSCSNDDENTTKTYKDITLTAGESYVIDGGSNWKSDEPLIATVNGNSVTAKRVGTTNIRNGESMFSITVTPRYDLYDNPCFRWGASPTQVNSFMSGYQELGQSGNVVVYSGKKAADYYTYLFENSKLKASSVFVNAMTYGDALVDFLTERYIVFDVNEDENMVGMVNIAQDMIIALSYEIQNTELYGIITYMPYSGNDAKNRTSMMQEIAQSMKKKNIGKPVSKAETDGIMKRFMQKN